MFSPSYSSLPALARLLFKNQHEIAGLFPGFLDSLNLPKSAFDVQFGTTHCSIGADTQDHSVRLSVSHDDLAYDIKLVLGDQGPSLKATLTDKRTGQTHQLDGAEFFTSKVPAAFEALHDEVLEHVKAMVPAALWEKLAKGVKPQQTGQATAHTQPATAGTPSAPADPAFTTYTVARRDQADLRFKAVPVLNLRTEAYRGRWNELHVYRTEGGKFIALRMGRSMWVGESDRVEHCVSEQVDGLSEFLGHSALGKAAKDALGLRDYYDIA